MFSFICCFLGSFFTFLGSWFLVSGSWFLVLGLLSLSTFLFSVPGSWFLILGLLSLSSFHFYFSWFLVFGLLSFYCFHAPCCSMDLHASFSLRHQIFFSPLFARSMFHIHCPKFQVTLVSSLIVSISRLMASVS